MDNSQTADQTHIDNMKNSNADSIKYNKETIREHPLDKYQEFTDNEFHIRRN